MWSSPPPCWSHGLFGICKPTPGSTNRAGLAFPLNWINRNQDGDVGIEERWGKKTYLKPWWGCTRCDSCTGCHPGEKIFKTINFWRKRFNCDHLPHASAGIVEDVLDLVQLRHPEKKVEENQFCGCKMWNKFCAKLKNMKGNLWLRASRWLSNNILVLSNESWNQFQNVISLFSFLFLLLFITVTIVTITCLILLFSRHLLEASLFLSRIF